MKYENDESIIPKESSWFGCFSNKGEILSVESTDLYKVDKLDLQSMLQNGKLILLESPGGHLILNVAWFTANIIPYLKET